MHSTMIKQILDFNKKTFDGSFVAVMAVQEHAEKMVRDFWGNSTFLPEEGKKLFGDWVKNYKSGLDDFKANVDSRFKLVEDYLINAADQMESSLKIVTEKVVPTAPVESVNQAKKKVVADLKKAVPVKAVVKKETVSVNKTGKQK